MEVWQQQKHTGSTNKNVHCEEMVSSQEHQPGIDRTARQIARETEIQK